MSRYDRFGYCSDPHEHEREGRDAGRWGERYDSEHRDRMDNARNGSPDPGDAAYAHGYLREMRRHEEQRAEEQAQERAAERRAAERRESEREEREQLEAYQYQQEQSTDNTETA